MRLISFAIVSLLAITVSAQSPHTVIQRAHQHRNTVIQRAHQHRNTVIQRAHQHRNTVIQRAHQHRNTVIQSARQLRSTVIQSAHQPQSTTTHILPEHHRESLQTALERLVEDYKSIQAETDRLQNAINAMGKKKSKIESEMNNLDQPEKETSVQKNSSIRRSSTIAQASKINIEDEMKAIMKEYGDVVKEIDLSDQIPE
ncbi:hypothetical protein BASA50_003852 [Batrachochytrium salamandrivorans]|uniref:Uncharacterized protein n=1 Tax=Batrachochytrium salamandrivorans TaxID=1357716 RepID=A0ABQ8FH84_9FUNG|nr:hypothetical protein BASA60_003597 [Batrachochytrium salamandrivorans]KAH6598238.1 hypothetical protein BASA50_003852 [Batrachochytrium salamandrivorans]KAH9251459.1 hypothetical protein BASA81_010696 [Batrachochytrium salamandrivorans]KAH9276020.1 hypothetical protein BASA83_001293 [Batrachochytrium salamandrivorans]